MSSPLVLVTGASGYLGAHCVKVLLDKGYRVRGTVRSLKNTKKIDPVKALDSSGTKIEFVEADLTTKESWPKAVSGCDYVLHVASPFPLAGTQETIDTAIAGTKNVLEACANENTLKKVVLTSSLVAIFEGHVDGRRLTENDWSILNDKTDAYYTSKTLAEKAAWEFVEEHKNKFRFTVVNPGFIVGPTLTDELGSSAEVIKKLMEAPALPKMRFICVDVRDVAMAHIAAMENQESDGMRIICAEADSRLASELFEKLTEEFESQGYCIPTRSIPDWIVKFGANFSDQFAKIAGRLGIELNFDNSRLREILKIDPNDTRKAVVDMVYTMIEKGFIKKTTKYRGPK
ncbi:unnamed protein product, partial [Mesorhabditis belari]|uniref:NAD-dependent epimerase/dehydratase domain-containing protein n=1 Tax=Mesorhabditis belari TaxID=2138241 RepID=A0AAF3EDL5_9BILA